MGNLYLQITSPSGDDLGATPINAAIELCDGSYGLIEHLNDDLDRVAEIESALIDGLRDQCEPISIDDFDPKIGMRWESNGFVGEIVGE